MHYTYPATADTTMYVPPIIFDRNAHLVPRLVRVADLLWAGAGLSGHYKTSSICPPTSVYSLSLSLVDRAGGWDAGEDAIGEDLHMYIKCFFALNGNLTTRSIFSAASHSNVHSSGKGIRGFFEDINARYKQAMRHMWGALDSGFVLKHITQLWWAKRVDGKGFAFPLLKFPPRIF
jgi:Glycosyl transferase family group 2